jgi:hypothetical protein
MYLTIIEKAALGVLAVLLCAAALWESFVYSPLVLLAFPLGLFALVVLGALTLMGFGSALGSDGAWPRRLRIALAMPLAVGLALLLAGPVMSGGSWARARLHLAENWSAYQARVAAAGPGSTLRFPYRNGMLGRAAWIVHADHVPTASDLQVTAKDMGRCLALAAGYHLCDHG